MWCGGRDCRVKSDSSNTRTILDSIETGKRRLGSSCPCIAAVLYFWPELALVKVKDSSRCQVLTRTVQGTDHFCSLSIRIYGRGIFITADSAPCTSLKSALSCKDFESLSKWFIDYSSLFDSCLIFKIFIIPKMEILCQKGNKIFGHEDQLFVFVKLIKETAT